MSKQFFTIGEITKAVTGGNERAARKLLNDAGANLDEYTENPDEPVSRETVIYLAAIRAGDIVGRRAARLLR